MLFSTVRHNIIFRVTKYDRPLNFFKYESAKNLFFFHINKIRKIENRRKRIHIIVFCFYFLGI